MSDVRKIYIRDTGKRWMNCETFVVGIDDLLVIRKVNLDRAISVEDNRLLPGLEFTFQGSGEPLGIDYLEESHRNQVYDAIWAALKGGG